MIEEFYKKKLEKDYSSLAKFKIAAFLFPVYKKKTTIFSCLEHKQLQKRDDRADRNIYLKNLSLKQKIDKEHLIYTLSHNNKYLFKYINNYYV